MSKRVIQLLRASTERLAADDKAGLAAQRAVTQREFAPDAGRWPASSGLWACAWPCSQRRGGTPDPVDALWNTAARSGDLCDCGCNAARGGGAGLHCSGVEGIA